MIIRKMKNVEMSEINYCDVDPQEGDFCFRLIEWSEEDDDLPMFELSRAVFEVHDDEDIENGPDPSLYLNDFKIIASGIGYTNPHSIKELIKEFHCVCDKSTCEICHPDPNIGY